MMMMVESQQYYLLQVQDLVREYTLPREHLFQPFATDPQRRGGTGLGLAICHGITQSLGGSIELVNRDAHGRVEGLDATVRLPLSPTTSAST